MSAPFEQRQGAALITLPGNDVADWEPFLEELAERLRGCARSADTYALVIRQDTGAAGTGDASVGEVRTPLPARDVRAKWARRLALIWQLECLPKPTVALLDGPVGGDVIGLTTFATHRVAGARYALALPDVGDGQSLPAGGVVHALARIAAGRGQDWAMTGRPVGRGEAVAAGIATHCIDAAAFPAIIAALADGQPVDPLLDGLHREVAVAAAVGHVATTVAGRAELAAAGLAELFARAAARDCRESLIASYRLACGRLAGRATVAELFSEPEGGDLVLKIRDEM